VAGEPHLREPQHGGVGCLGLGRIAGGLGGLRGQHPHQPRRVRGQVGRLLRQPPRLGAVAGGHRQEAAGQHVVGLAPPRLLPRPLGPARRLEDPQEGAPHHGHGQTEDHGEQDRGGRGGVGPPAQPDHAGPPRVVTEREGSDRDRGQQDEDDASTDHAGFSTAPSSRKARLRNALT
jgi:hypothetical protein